MTWMIVVFHLTNGQIVLDPIVQHIPSKAACEAKINRLANTTHEGVALECRPQWVKK